MELALLVVDWGMFALGALGAVAVVIAGAVSYEDNGTGRDRLVLTLIGAPLYASALLYFVAR